ncbi:MAG: hypothetical protein QN189_04830 [Armatimonadota bacterium]|nr:hypothetical protein [Armatimonadota bacterium]MDR7434437.1 hypothetical protein [Armatimonadota bacterium]
MHCAYHPDALAITYCARCGRALCKDCVVRLSQGNFCERCLSGISERRTRRPWGLYLGASIALLIALLLIARLFGT